MKTVGKALVIAGAAGAAIAGAAYALRTLRARKTTANAETGVRQTTAETTRKAAAEAAGVMFVGAVDEVELGPVDAVDVFDPAEVPSEHSEINELRTKMPMG